MDYKDLVVHARTQRAIDALAATPTHAVLLSGSPGSGRLSLARLISQHYLGNISNNPYFKQVSSETSISIEAIRELQSFIGLKVPGRKVIARVIVIEQADSMTVEAQNALLKTLEEPPADTLLILTAERGSAMLPTIQSRVRLIEVLPPNRVALVDHFKARGHNLGDIDKALLLSGELPGLAHSILSDDQDHPLHAATVHARGILQSKAYERLLHVDALSKQKQLCLDVFFVLSLMARTTLAKPQSAAQTKRWHKIMRASYDASELLKRSANAKLVLTNFMLQI